MSASSVYRGNAFADCDIGWFVITCSSLITLADYPSYVLSVAAVDRRHPFRCDRKYVEYWLLAAETVAIRSITCTNNLLVMVISEPNCISGCARYRCCRSPISCSLWSIVCGILSAAVDTVVIQIAYVRRSLISLADVRAIGYNTSCCWLSRSVWLWSIEHGVLSACSVYRGNAFADCDIGWVAIVYKSRINLAGYSVTFQEWRLLIVDIRFDVIDSMQNIKSLQQVP